MSIPFVSASLGGAAPSLTGLVLLLVQLTLLTWLASVIAQRVRRFDAGRTHSIWLATVLLALVILPIHFLGWGWPIDVAPMHARATAERFSGDAPRQTLPAADVRSRQPATSPQPDVAVSGPANAPEQLPGAVAPQSRTTRAIPRADESPTRPFANPNAIAAPPLLPEPPSQTPYFTETRIRNLLAGVYLIGLMWFALRLAVAEVRLWRVASHAEPASGAVLAIAESAAQALGRKRLPRIATSDQITIPLVFGVVRPVVLLPKHFEDWHVDEQRATLLHELTHILRRDMLTQAIAAMNRLLYWFHPASWFLDRRLCEAREWATDRAVVEHSGRRGFSLSPERYAECLVNVVARSSRSPVHSLTGSAMANASGETLETRLKLILERAPLRSRASEIVVQLSIGLLIVATAITTLQFRTANAQTATETQADPAEDTAEQVSAEQGPAEQASDVYLASPQPGDENLWQQINTAQPRDAVSPSDAGGTVNVSGVVRDQAGEPIAEAVVLLRESSNSRISDQRQDIDSEYEMHLRRVRDVLAKTTTDAQGRFEFKQVATPAYSRAESRWRGDIVAASASQGITFRNLHESAESSDINEQVELTLTPTTAIEGQYVSPGGDPIANAIVTLNRVVKPDPRVLGRPSRVTHFYASQLSPVTVTDASGRFRFEHLPEAEVVSLWIYDSNPESTGAYTEVSTSAELATANLEGLRSYFNTSEIQTSPATIRADPGIEVTGTVLTVRGAPVANATIRFGAQVLQQRSDSAGRVAFRVPTRTFDSYQKNKRPITIWTTAKHPSNWLPSRIEMFSEQLLEGQPFNATLQPGTRVTGTIVDSDGEPLADIEVFNQDMSRPMVSGKSDAEGRFEVLLPPGTNVLVFTSEREDLQLASRLEFFRNRDDPSRLLTKPVNVTEGKPQHLAPIRVSRSEAIQVIASLPDGTAAKHASVTIREEQTEPSPFGDDVERTTTVDRSTTLETNSLGRVDITPSGVLSDKAWIEVQLTQDGKAYHGKVPVDAVENGGVALVLSPAPMLQGRVLIDGQAAAGAMVSVGESKRMRRKGPMGFVDYSTVSNHRSLTTDDEGYYRMPAVDGKTYSVSLQSIPGENVNPAIGHTSRPSGDGNLVVNPFQLRRGQGRIAGHVVDGQGNPVADVTVRVDRERDVTPSLWVGHREESQETTDAAGAFVLERVPPGSYRLRVTGPRSADRTTRPASTTISAQSGETDLTVTLVGANAIKPLPRLKPVRIESISKTP